MNYSFGGFNLLCQFIAFGMILHAVIIVRALAKKNGFNEDDFANIKLNAIFAGLILLGQTVWNFTLLIIYTLFLLGTVSANMQVLFTQAGQLFLITCVFLAFLLLLKIIVRFIMKVEAARAEREARERARKSTQSLSRQETEEQ